MIVQSLSLLPDLFAQGVNADLAPNWYLDRSKNVLGTAVDIAETVIEPMPTIAASRGLVLSQRGLVIAGATTRSSSLPRAVSCAAGPCPADSA